MPINIALLVARLTWVFYLVWPLAVLAAYNTPGDGWSSPMDGAFIKHAPLTNITAGVMRAVRLPKQSKKFSATAATVCKTPEFDLTAANWRDSKASTLLKAFALENAGNKDYAARGLIGALAQHYLGRQEYHCAMGQSHACMVSCNEVVSLVEDPAEARAVYFILTAARHYLEVMEIADRAMLAAQVNVGQWSDAMSVKFFWTNETPHDRVFKLTIGLMSSFITFMFFTFIPLIPFHHAEGVLQGKLDALEKGETTLTGIPADEANLLLINQKKELQEKIMRAKATGNWLNVGYNAIGNGIPILGIPAMEFLSWEGYEKAQVHNVAELGLAVSQLISESRGKNAKSIVEFFSGRLVDSDGTTMLQKILESGSFLSVSAQMLHQWSGPNVEKRLTDALKFRILSEALKSQGVFIHCTKDMNSFTCENDSRGPQNLKACIDGRVCYLSKWSGRGFWWRHHAEEPFGVDSMGEWPFLVSPEDIIISSYKTYILSKGAPGKDYAHAKFMSNEEMISPQNFLDASTPGAFYLPVCVNDRFHQNTPLDDYTLWDDFNQYSEKKSLPCSCGPAGWGEETEQVWLDTGLAMAKHADRYKCSFCPKQLAAKIPKENKLELYVHECRLGISHAPGFFNRNGFKNERHPHCDVVLDILTRIGAAPGEVDPYMKLGLECKAGLHVTGSKRKPVKECDLYMGAGYEELARLATFRKGLDGGQIEEVKQGKVA